MGRGRVPSRAPADRDPRTSAPPSTRALARAMLGAPRTSSAPGLKASPISAMGFLRSSPRRPLRFSRTRRNGR